MSSSATRLELSVFDEALVATGVQRSSLYMCADAEGVVANVEANGSTTLLDEYFEARAEANLVVKPENGVLKEMQVGVEGWLRGEDGPLQNGGIYTYEDYTTRDYSVAFRRIARLVDYLHANVPEVSEAELRASELFLRSTAGMYDSRPLSDTDVHPDADGSFAFVVPARMSRQNTEYGQEVEQVIPALRYVPRELRAAMMVGLPPFIIDRYNVTEDGKRGYLMFAPVFPDMAQDLSVGEARKACVELVNRTVDFAYSRLGTEVIGLGATLPGYTRFGQAITNPNVVTTTGHGGTIDLILKTMERAQAEGRVSEEFARKIGVLGLGSIGASIAEVVRANYPDAQITVYDLRQNLTKKVAGLIGAVAAGSEKEVIAESGIIISALPDIRLSLAHLGLTREQTEGKLFVDDSQPAAFDPQEIKDFGGTLAWVVGQDGPKILRTDYTYGNTLAARNDLFGCEAEAASVARLNSELKVLGLGHDERLERLRRVAIREAVTPARVHDIGQLFKLYGITAAPLQAFGQYV